jgi:hypothetical protein
MPIRKVVRRLLDLAIVKVVFSDEAEEMNPLLNGSSRTERIISFE